MTIILPRICPWSFHLNGCARILFCLSTVEDLINLTTIMTIIIMIIILAISHKCNVHMSMVNQWTANVSSCTLTAKTQSQVNDDNQSTFLLNRRRTRSRAVRIESISTRVTLQSSRTASQQPLLSISTLPTDLITD